MTMRVRAAAVATMAMLAAQAASAACMLQKVAEFDVSAGRFGAVVATTLDGKPAKFAVDTGSNVNVLTTAAAERLGLHGVHSRWEVVGVGGRIPNMSVSAKEWRIGSSIARNVQFQAVRIDGVDFDGLLSATPLLQQDVEFDLKAGKIRLFKPNGCTGDQVVYWGQAYAVAPMELAPGPSIMVPVRVNGSVVRAMVDSGTTRSHLEADTAKAVGAAPLPEPREVSVAVGSAAISSRIVHVDSFSLGDETIRNTSMLSDPIYMVRGEVMNSRVPRKLNGDTRMILGYDFFRSHRIYMAVSQQKVYVSYEGGPVFDTSKEAPDRQAPPAGGGDAKP